MPEPVTLDQARREVEALRAKHIQTPPGPDDYCVEEGQLWPCDVIRVLAILDRLAPPLEIERLEEVLAEGLHSTCDWEHYIGHEPNERDELLAAGLAGWLTTRGFALSESGQVASTEPSAEPSAEP